jgi:hypothetical protein
MEPGALSLPQGNVERNELIRDVRFTGDWADASTGTVTDWAIPDGVTIVRWQGTSAATMNGIAKPTSGRMLVIENAQTVANELTLAHNVGSPTFDSFLCPNNADLVLKRGMVVFVFYDAVALGWRVEGLGEHGAVFHKDITRSIFIPARSSTVLDGGTNVTIGTLPDAFGVVQLADAATQGWQSSFWVPADWSTGAINYVIYWTPGSTDGTAHTVRWSMDVIERAAGQSVAAAGTTTAFTGTSSAKTIDQLQLEPAQALLTPAAANNYIRFDLRRVGADAADTYVGAVNVVMLRFDYTATQ